MQVARALSSQTRVEPAPSVSLGWFGWGQPIRTTLRIVLFYNGEMVRFPSCQGPPTTQTYTYPSIRLLNGTLCESEFPFIIA